MLALHLLPERDCGACTPDKKRRWGCHEKAPTSISLDGEDIWHCPRKPLLDEPDFYNEVFRCYAWRKRGHLSEPGTWADQPAALVQFYEIIDKANSDADEVKRKRRPGK